MITEAQANIKGQPVEIGGLASAREHLTRHGWSYRRAAGALGCSSGHLTLVLTGQRQSAVLLARILSLGQAPEIPATSTYRRAAKQPRRSEW